MVISTGSFTVMTFVDRMFLLWHSSEEMSAALPAGTLYWAILCFPFGVAQYATTFVAQYVGAERREAVGRIIWQGVYVALLAAPFFAMLWPITPWLFDFFKHPESVRGFEIDYFRLLLFGAPAGVASIAFASFYIGRGDTRIVMYANLVQTALNIALDYVLVFGIGPFPEMGIRGAAIATVISVWLKMFAFWWLMHRKDYPEMYQLGNWRPNLKLMLRLFRYGGPNGIHFVTEAAAVTLALLFLGQLGADALAATTLALNVNSVAFMPMIGVSIAVTTIVGQQLTRGEPDLASRATWTALVLGGVYSGVFALSYLLCPRLFLMGHAAGADPETFPQIQQQTVVLLRFVAAYCLFDTLQVVFVGALKGAGDTLFVLANTVVLSTALVLAGWLGMEYMNYGLLWWWGCFTGWICLLGVAYVLRFLGGKWRTMSVIEPSVVTPTNASPENTTDNGQSEFSKTGEDANPYKTPQS